MTEQWRKCFLLSLLLASEIPVCVSSPTVSCSPLCPQMNPCVTQLPYYNWPGRDEDLRNGCVILPLFIQMAFLWQKLSEWWMHFPFRTGSISWDVSPGSFFSEQVISLSIWAAVSHFWCLLEFSWGWLQALRYSIGVGEEEEGASRTDQDVNTCRHFSRRCNWNLVGVTELGYRMVPKRALIILPCIPTWTKPQWCWHQNDRRQSI